MSYNLPTSPQPVSINQQINLLDQWNADSLLKSHLKQVKEPSPDRPVDAMLVLAKIKVLKMRIRGLRALCTEISPRRSVEIESELGAELFKHKVLSWSIFPVLSFPTEILLEIFRLVVETTKGHHSEAIKMKLRLTWVCKHFREAALSYGRLWSYIWFFDRAPWTRSLAFFQRAGNAPLDLRIVERVKQEGDTEDPPAITTAQMSWLLDIVLRKIATIRSLYVEVKDMYPTVVVLDSLSRHGPPEIMEHFVIRRTGGNPKQFDIQADLATLRNALTLCRGHLPKLESLGLDGIAVNWSQLPLTNLTSIDIRHIANRLLPDEEEFRAILNVPRLQRLALVAAGRQIVDTNLIPFSPVTLPNLRDLTLGDANAVYIRYVLEHILAPGLTCLNLTVINGGDRELFEMLTGRFPEIKLLALYSLAIDPTEGNLRSMIRFFDSIPKLRMLKIGNLPSPVVHALSQDPRPFRDPVPNVGEGSASESMEEVQPAVLFPGLRTLQFAMVDADGILKLVEQRNAMGIPFTRVWTPQKTVQDIGPEKWNKLLQIAQVAVNPDMMNIDEGRLRLEVGAMLPDA